VTSANVAKNVSAENMIGKPVVGANGDRVGNVHDIILNQDGVAKYLIIADGSSVSVGDKKAVFDYSAINGRDANGGLLTNISEANIDQAKALSYDVNNNGRVNADA